jgi:hypothetical protein
MIRWLRVVLPPGEILLTFAAFYLFSEGGLRFIEWRLGQPIPLQGDRPSTVELRFACVGYGAFRVFAFHPLFNPRYRAWLQAAPWTIRKRLPAGPIQPVPQDGVVLLVLCGLAFSQPDRIVLLVSLLLSSYLAILGFTLWATGIWAYAYAIACGLGLIVYLWGLPWECAGTAVLFTAIGYLGLRRSLVEFPWDTEWGNAFREKLATLAKGQMEKEVLGWPFGALRPRPVTSPAIGTRTAIMTSLLVGWWVYVIGTLADPMARQVVLPLLGGGLTIGLAAIRLARYCRGYLPPISLWGRIRSFRWIIPGYDKVFLGPLAALLIGTCLPGILNTGLHPDLGVPVSVSLAWMAGLIIGPNLLEWRLTGGHRMVPALTAGECVEVSA